MFGSVSSMALLLSSAIPSCDHVLSCPLAATSMTVTDKEKHSGGSKSVTLLTKTCQCSSAVCLSEPMPVLCG